MYHIRQTATTNSEAGETEVLWPYTTLRRLEGIMEGKNRGVDQDRPGSEEWMPTLL